jgi:hypothetical protein
MGPKAVLEAVVKRKSLNPCRESEVPIIQPIALRYTAELSRLLFT